MEKDKVLHVIEEAARKKLTVLDLPFNQLKTLPAEIVELKNITTLNLPFNQAKTLPAGIVELKNITTLNLVSRQLNF